MAEGVTINTVSPGMHHTSIMLPKDPKKVIPPGGSAPTRHCRRRAVFSFAAGRIRDWQQYQGLGGYGV